MTRKIHNIDRIKNNCDLITDLFFRCLLPNAIISSIYRDFFKKRLLILPLFQMAFVTNILTILVKNRNLYNQISGWVTVPKLKGQIIK
jgi:hypothetical protein